MTSPLPVVPDLLRHPNDGWELAQPYKMGRSTRLVTEKLIDAIIPDAPRKEDTVAVVLRQTCVMLQYTPRATIVGFIALLHAINWSPLWTLRGLVPMTRLSKEKRRQALMALANSRFLPIRLMMLGPQGLAMSAYFDLDMVHEALEYEPRAFMRERVLLRRRLLEEANTDMSNAVAGESP